MKSIDLNFFPGFTRKAISFTIDDGNLKLDRRFINTVKPAGITGSFNLISSSITKENKDEYLALYSGYEIANHMKHHPMGLREGFQPCVSSEPFDPATADSGLLYKSDKEGLYFYCVGKRWFYAADNESYIRLINEGKCELEAVFGVGKIKDFVWPYGRQSDALCKEVSRLGYRSVRGSVYNGFSLPEDRSNWGFYADCGNMTERAAEFEALPDDGELKAFIFGVHSHDFENAGKWNVLQDFCDKYGNRPEDFFYGTPGEIFDTEDAIKSAVITDGGIENKSPRELYAMIDGERAVIAPNSIYKL